MQVFRSFAAALRIGGALILDARDWEKTFSKKNAESIFLKKVDVNGHALEFSSATEFDLSNRFLLIHETHKYRKDETHYDFTMKCWTKKELAENMNAAGFGEMDFLDSYMPESASGKTDRIVAKGALVRCISA